MKKLIIVVVLLIIAVNVLVAAIVVSDFRQQKKWEATRQPISIRIQYGDTIYGYWIKYAPNWMSYEQFLYEIKELNNMTSCSIYAGQTIQIYIEE